MKRLSHQFLGISITFALVASACSDEKMKIEEAPAREATDAAAPAVDAGPSVDASARVAVAFDPRKAELPEGLAIDGDTAYIGLAITGEIVKVDLRTGARVPFGRVPFPVAVDGRPGGVVTGLAIDLEKNVYATLDVTPPQGDAGSTDAGAGPVTGIYKIPPAGGVAALFARSPELVYPNGMSLVGSDLFVTDSIVGAVFKVDLRTGGVAKWVQDETLLPKADNCGPSNVRLGANGIARVDNAFFVSNTDRAQIVRVPIDGSGNPGPPVVFLGPDCARLFGVDDVRGLDTGELAYAVNYANTVEAVAPDGRIRTLLKGSPLDGPASLEVHGPAKRLVVTNSAFATFFSNTNPAPSLVSFPWN